MKLQVNLSTKSYDIIIERGVISRLADVVDVSGKVMIVSDNGVPQKYIDTVLSQCPNGVTHIVQSGEGAKSFAVYKSLCEALLAHSFTRSDMVIALGGGVVGDLAGFAASSYMRGINFVNIPTTTLSQIDSSVGGKVGINLDHVKNIVGAFYHPNVVIVDSDTLYTLPKRHFANGLAEAVKSGLIYDAELFNLMESANIYTNIDEIIYRSLTVKRDVVVQDEKEQSLRKILNFGHTIGHGIESVYMPMLLHGECVALGMLPMIDDEILRNRTVALLQKLSLPTSFDYDKEKVFAVMCKDKKSGSNGNITIIKVNTLGVARPIDVDKSELLGYLS